MRVYSLKELIDLTKTQQIRLISDIIIVGERIEPHEVKIIAETLKAHKCSNLDTIDLASNDIGDKGMKYLADFLKKAYLTNLRKINLSDNNIGDDGMKYITDALKESYLPNLHEIGLEDNRIRSRGVIYLADTLKEGNLPMLERIRLRYYNDQCCEVDLAGSNISYHENIENIEKNALETIYSILDNNRILTYKIQCIVENKYSEEWPSLSGNAQKAYFHLKYAEYLQHSKISKFTGALGQYSAAMHHFKSDVTPKFIELKEQIQNAMIAIISRNAEETNLLPVFIQEKLEKQFAIIKNEIISKNSQNPNQLSILLEKYLREINLKAFNKEEIEDIINLYYELEFNDGESNIIPTATALEKFNTDEHKEEEVEIISPKFKEPTLLPIFIEENFKKHIIKIISAIINKTNEDTSLFLAFIKYYFTKCTIKASTKAEVKDIVNLHYKLEFTDGEPEIWSTSVETLGLDTLTSDELHNDNLY